MRTTKRPCGDHEIAPLARGKSNAGNHHIAAAFDAAQVMIQDRAVGAGDRTIVKGQACRRAPESSAWAITDGHCRLALDMADDPREGMRGSEIDIVVGTRPRLSADWHEIDERKGTVAGVYRCR